MLYKIVMLSLGLGLLFLHERLMVRKRVKALPGNFSRPLPSLGWYISPGVVSEVLPFRMDVAGIDLKDIPAPPEQVSYREALIKFLNLHQVPLSIRVSVFSPSLLTELEALQSLVRGGVLPVQLQLGVGNVSLYSAEGAAQAALLGKEVIPALRQLNPHLQVMVAGPFSTPQQAGERAWNAFLDQFSAYWSGLLASSAPEGNGLGSGLRMSPNFGSAFYQGAAPLAWIFDPYPPATEALSWRQSLEKAHQNLLSLRRSSLRQWWLGGLGLEAHQADLATGLIAQFLAGAAWGKQYAQGLDFEQYSDEGNLAESLSGQYVGWLFTRQWEMSALIWYFGEQAQTLQVDSLFLKKCYFEQIFSHPGEADNLLRPDTLSARSGVTSGAIRLTPCSLTRISNVDFIPLVAGRQNPELFSWTLSPPQMEAHLNLSYALKRRSRVSLKVYDSGGQKKFGLENQLQLPGHYELQLDTRSLKKGRYLVQLVLADQLDVRYVEK